MITGKLQLIYLIFILQMVSSNGIAQTKKSPNYLRQIQLVNNSPDSIRIPRQFNKQYIKLYDDLSQYSNQLGLSGINDSIFEFRVWLNIGGISRKHRLVIIKLTKNNFSAESIRFVPVWNNNQTEFSFESLERKKVVPKSGWNNFANKVITNNFLSLFDLNKESSDNGGIDGQSYLFEIISSRHYWLNDFANLFDDNTNIKVEKEAQRVIKLIEYEFSFFR